MKTTEPIRDKRKIRELADYYLKRAQIRNYVLVVMGLYTALRISDLLRLCWEDVYDFDNKHVRRSITLIEKKTGKSKTIALNARAVSVLSLYSNEAREGSCIIENKRTGRAISRVQAHRIIRAASDALGFRGSVSCHSLRKTFGYHAWQSGVPLALIMEIFNHSSITVTRRYLGVTQDDIDGVYLSLSLIA